VEDADAEVAELRQRPEQLAGDEVDAARARLKANGAL
jgi:hypothetical protein